MNYDKEINSKRILGLYSNADEILKGESDELVKGGEGSRGGKIIGHTKSGKPIYDSFDHPSHKDFTKEDHGDAATINFVVGKGDYRDESQRIPKNMENRKQHQKKYIELDQKDKEKENVSDHTHKVLSTLDKHVSVNHRPDKNGTHRIDYGNDSFGYYNPKDRKVHLTNSIGYYQEYKHNPELGPHQGRFEKDLAKHGVEVQDDD
jgi:hypothetical protein